MSVVLPRRFLCPQVGGGGGSGAKTSTTQTRQKSLLEKQEKLHGKNGSCNVYFFIERILRLPPHERWLKVICSSKNQSINETVIDFF